jgi:integrase
VLRRNGMAKGKYGSGRVFQPSYKTPDGTRKVVNKWYVEWRDGAGQHRESTGAKNEREARGILNVKLAAVFQGTAPRAEDKALRYGDIREDLLRYFRVNKMASLEILADGTESAKGLTKLDEYFHLGARTGDKGDKIAAFSPKAWEDNFVTARRREGVSDGTIANSGKLLDRMFKLAVENGRIAVVPKVMIPTSPEPREVYLSKEQFDVLVSDKGMANRFHPLLTFLFYQGVRVTETFNIKWNQIDLDNGVFQPKASENKTKNKDVKPLQRETIKALRSIEKNGEFVFEKVRSEGKNPVKRLEKAFRAEMLKLRYGKITWQCSQCREITNAAAPGTDSLAVECPSCKNGIPMQYHFVGPTPHCLRASTVVFYRESGMSDPEIMAITGHKSSKAFLGYSRTRVENIKTRMDAANKTREKVQKEIAAA